ncbi:MAG: CRISPR-associated protein Cas4 [Bacillota bacterium]
MTHALTVSDVKQYVYCPRIIYYTYVVPVEKKPSFKMSVGQEAHLDLERLEKRRTLRRYQLADGQRSFGLLLHSSRLGLNGRLDCLITSTLGLYPVDYKHTCEPPGLNHKYQLAAYALLIEQVLGQTVRAGFIYALGTDRVWPVEITPSVRRHVINILSAARRIIAEQRFPGPQRSCGRCRDCEYRNYCLDRGDHQKEAQRVVFLQ